MVTVEQLTTNLKSYIDTLVGTMAKTNPMISFMKPLITRVLDKNFDKAHKMLELIADSEGNVDVENILTEMLESVMKTDTFIFKTSFIGDVEIGNGNIKLNLPMTSKRLVLDLSDLETFKEMMLTTKE